MRSPSTRTSPGTDDAAALHVEQARGMQARPRAPGSRRRDILCPGAGRQERAQTARPRQTEPEFHLARRIPIRRSAANRLYSRPSWQIAWSPNRDIVHETSYVHDAPLDDSLPTPCLLLDRARLAKNAARMRARTAGLGVTFRPHLKTAKSLDAASFVLGSPPGPATVSTLREAEIFGAARSNRLALRRMHQPAET